MPTNGRLDQQRYQYVTGRQTRSRVPRVADAAFTELARRFFRWVGPATLGRVPVVRRARRQDDEAGGRAAGTGPAAPGSDRLLLPDRCGGVQGVRGPDDAAVLAGEQPRSDRGEPARSQSLIDPKDRERDVMVDAATKSVGRARGPAQPCDLDRGQIIGLWEYDVDSNAIVWATFGWTKDKALAAAVEETRGVRARSARGRAVI